MEATATLPNGFDCPSCGYNYGGVLDCLAHAYGLDAAMSHVPRDADGIRTLKCQRPDGTCTAQWTLVTDPDFVEAR